jgi:hypothetical protein
MAKKDEVLAEIARKHLGVPTLEARNSDRLDFHEVAVWEVKAALEAAYQAGADDPPKTCVLCGGPLGEENHNAAPLANGRCCNACHPKVLAERVRQATFGEGGER